MAAEKFLKLPDNGNDPESTAATQTGGAANGGKIPALRDDGTFDPTMFGPEVASPDVEQGIATEALAAGDLVNTYLDNSTGTPRNGVRKAVAASYGTRAMGFVIAAAAANGTVTVYKSGAPNASVTGMTIGQQWLSATIPGKAASAPPTAAGSVQQKVGYASAANMLHVQLGPAYKI
jgi:hypothetical protein